MSTIGDARQMVVAGQYPLGAEAAGGPADAGGGMGAADVWRIVKQHKWLILITFVVLYMLVGVATILVYRYAPEYSSEAYIRLIPPTSDMAQMQDTYVPRDYILHQLATEAARLKSPEILLDVLAQPEIKGTSYYRSFGEGQGAFEECLADLQRRLGAVPIRDTYLVRVSLAMREKSEATLIVRTIVDRFLGQTLTDVRDTGRERLEELRNRRAEVERRLQDSRQKIAAARAQRDMPALEQDRQVQAELISMLNNTLAELKTRRADVQAQLDSIRGIDPRNLPLSAEMRVIIENDPLLRYYRNQVEQLEVQLAVMRENRFGEEHRLMKELDSQRNSYYEKEVSRREELIQDLRARQVEQLNQELARIDMMMGTLREQLAEREAVQKDLDHTIQTIKGWEQDELLLQGELEQIGRALLEAQTRVGVQQREGRLKLAMAPRDATRPSRPDFKIWLGGGFVLCVLAGLGLAFLREFTDQALRTPLDVARYGRLSVLGCVPLLEDEEGVDVAEIEQVTRQAPQSMISEAFRQVRAHLTFSGPLESQRVLLVTSPRPEDGKTAVAVNLAVTFAQAHERTLLIDCNFRRPGLGRAFANTRTEGLSNVLVGHVRLADVVSRTELPRLTVVACGPMPPNPAELLGSPAMRELLAEAKQQYDRIIIDGPPCLLISDALIIASQVDAVVLVARAVQGTKGTLKRAREQLQRTGARVIGAVLNGAKAQPGGYFRQQYREFYEYMDEDVVLHPLPEGPPKLGSGPTQPDDSPDRT